MVMVKNFQLVIKLLLRLSFIKSNLNFWSMKGYGMDLD